jgi:hypothetical protein
MPALVVTLALCFARSRSAFSTAQRRLHALEQVEKRELRSLETALLKERRIEDRERTGREPPPAPDETPEKPINVTAEFEKASAEPSPTHVDEFNKAAKKPIDLTAEFERASGSGDSGGEASGDAAQDPAPEAEIKIQRRRRTRERTPDAERSTRGRSDRDSRAAPLLRCSRLSTPACRGPAGTSTPRHAWRRRGPCSSFFCPARSRDDSAPIFCT